MAAVNNATTTTSVTEIVNSEYISRVILEAHRDPTLASMLAWVVDASNTNAGVYTFPQITAVTQTLTEASGLGETDLIAAEEQLLTEVQATGVVVGNRRAISDVASQDALVSMVELAIRENTAAIQAQADTDLLLNIKSATNIASFAGSALDITKMGQAIGQWRALKPTNMNGAIVLDYAQVEDLAASVRSSSSAIFGSAFGGQAAGSLLNSSSVGFLGNYEGLSLYQTGLLGQTGADTNAAIFSAGAGGAMGMAVWRQMRHRAQREETRDMTDLVSTVRYGTCLCDDSGMVEIVSLST